MSFYVILFVLFLCVLYFGKVLGLILFCENCSDFKTVKKRVHLVPILETILVFVFAYECIKEKNLKQFVSFLLFSEKCILILIAMAELEPKLQASHKTKPVRNKRKSVIIPTLASIKSVLFDAQDHFEYRYQYM